jgi:hypothetical protein
VVQVVKCWTQSSSVRVLIFYRDRGLGKFEN